MGAQIAGCNPRIAIDINPSKLAAAKALGATHCIDASCEDPMAAIQKIGPLDFAIEASGSTVVMKQAFQSVRSQGGTAVVVGNARAGQELTLDPKEFNQGKRLLGTWGGDNSPDQHFPQYCNLIRDGHLHLASFTERIYSLEQINQALEDLESGQVLRPLLDMNPV